MNKYLEKIAAQVNPGRLRKAWNWATGKPNWDPIHEENMFQEAVSKATARQKDASTEFYRLNHLNVWDIKEKHGLFPPIKGEERDMYLSKLNTAWKEHINQRDGAFKEANDLSKHINSLKEARKSQEVTEYILNTTPSPLKRAIAPALTFGALSAGGYAYKKSKADQDPATPQQGSNPS